jgi:hypothetical protein
MASTQDADDPISTGIQNYHFSTNVQSGCSSTIPFAEARPNYTEYRAVPVHLVEFESGMRGLGARPNKCGILTGGVNTDGIKTPPATFVEFCPVVPK